MRCEKHLESGKMQCKYTNLYGAYKRSKTHLKLKDVIFLNNCLLEEICHEGGRWTP